MSAAARATTWMIRRAGVRGKPRHDAPIEVQTIKTNEQASARITGYCKLEMGLGETRAAARAATERVAKLGAAAFPARAGTNRSTAPRVRPRR